MEVKLIGIIFEMLLCLNTGFDISGINFDRFATQYEKWVALICDMIKGNESHV